MNKKQKQMILESLDESRRDEKECIENGDEDHAAYIYQGWVEALEYVINTVLNTTEKEVRDSLK